MGEEANRIKQHEADHLSGPLVSDSLAAAITHGADKMGGAERHSAAKAAERDWEGQRGIASFRQEEGFDQVGQPFVLAAPSDGQMIDGWGRCREEEEEEIKRRV